MPQLSAGLTYLKPRFRRQRAPGQSRGLSRKTQVGIVIAGTLATTGYYLWQRHLQPTDALHIGAGPLAVAKSEAPAAVPVPPPTPVGGDLIARARLENELVYSDLQSFVCHEQMERFKGRLNGDTQRQIDTVTAQVSFENGSEHYNGVHQNSHERASISSIPGAWSEGEFGTLLRQTHALLGTQAVSLKGETNLGGIPASIYTLAVSEQDSPWDLIITGKAFKIPFRTDVWVAKSTGQILKIERTSTNIPPGDGISQLRWSVTLEPVDMDGKTWLLPKGGEYEVQYAESGRREFNVMTFSDYHRYSARTVLHF